MTATWHGLMAGGVVLGALEGQERVDGRYRRRVCGAKANLGAAQTIGGLIGDLGAAAAMTDVPGTTWACT